MSSFDRFSLTIARWLTNVYDADDPAGKSTTLGDVTPPGIPPFVPLFWGYAGVRRNVGG